MDELAVLTFLSICASCPLSGGRRSHTNYVA
jgi:hypothetical protein